MGQSIRSLHIEWPPKLLQWPVAEPRPTQRQEFVSVWRLRETQTSEKGEHILCWTDPQTHRSFPLNYEGWQREYMYAKRRLVPRFAWRQLVCGLVSIRHRFDPRLLLGKCFPLPVFWPSIRISFSHIPPSQIVHCPIRKVKISNGGLVSFLGEEIQDLPSLTMLYHRLL